MSALGSILILEDRRQICNPLEIMLRHAGYTARVVNVNILKGAEWVSWLEDPEVSPELIILDLESPELRGLNVLPLLDRQGARQPVLAISEFMESAAVAELQTQGVNEHLARPFHPQTFLAVVAELLS